jgi:lactoylglutathione lyase
VSFHHVNFRCVDPRPSVEFYRAFGFELFGCMDLGPFHTLYLRLPADEVCIELTAKPEGDEEWLGKAGTGHFAVVVDDVDAKVAELAGRGLEPVIAPYHPGDRPSVYVCFYEDPGGNRIELMNGWFSPPQESLPLDLAYG